MYGPGFGEYERVSHELLQGRDLGYGVEHERRLERVVLLIPDDGRGQRVVAQQVRDHACSKTPSKENLSKESLSKESLRTIARPKGLALWA